MESTIAQGPESDETGWKAPDRRTMADIPVSQLIVSQEYQRQTPASRVEQLFINWDINLSEAITVVPKGDGTYQVLEGQGRTLTAQRAVDEGLAPGDYTLKAVIIPDLDTAGSAGVVKGISTGRRTYDKLAIWRADLAKGDPDVLAADQALREFGLSVSETSITAVAGVRRVMNSGATLGGSYEAVRRVFSVLTGAWDDLVDDRYDARLIVAVHDVFTYKASYRQAEVDVQRLTATLATLTPARWVKLAKDSTDGQLPLSAELYNAVIAAYNKGLQQAKRLERKAPRLRRVDV